MLSYLCPHECVDSLAKVDISRLKEQGIRAILLDLDNTIVPWQRYEIPPESRDWVRAAKEAGIKMYIASNTHSPRRLYQLAEELDLPCQHNILKPRRRGLRRALETLGIPAENAVIIGDQMLTDVLGGNRMGMRTILVQPLHKREFVGTKLSRIFERGLLAYFRRRGMLGTKRAAK